MTTRRDVEWRLDHLEGESKGDGGPTDEEIQAAMWSALVSYHTNDRD